MAFTPLIAAIVSISASAGGMAIQYLLRPKIKQEPVDRGKMDDVRVMGSDYGAIIPRTYGRTRLAGNLIFSSGVQHYTTTTGGGGGGKKVPSGGQTTTHTYKTSVGILICRNEVDRFRRIWADADLLSRTLTDVYYDSFEAEDGTLSGGATSYVDATASGGYAVQGLGAGGQVIIDCSGVDDPPTPASSDPNETADIFTRISFYYKSATEKTVTIDTDVTTATDYTFPASADWTVYTLILPLSVDTITYSGAAAVPNLDKVTVEKYWEIVPFDDPDYPYDKPTYFSITGAVNPDIAYPTNLLDPSEYYNYNPPKNGTTGTYSLTTPIPGETVRFYTGTETQTAEAAIKSWLDARYGTGQGDLQASAMRGLTYMVFQDRTLKSNRVENFTVETDTGDDATNSILADMFADVGLSSGDYNITATSSLTQIGFLDHQASSRKSLIDGLARYHGFRTGEIDGKIYTILDTQTSVATLDNDDLRAHADGDEWPRYDAEIIIKDPVTLPREVRVAVMQPDLDYHNEAVPARLFSNVDGDETREYTFPIVDDADSARLAAEKLQLKEYAEDKAYEFWGMPSMAKYAIGDVITVPIEGQTYKMRIEKKQMTLPIGKIRFQCVAVNPFTPLFYQADTNTGSPQSTEKSALSQFPRNSIAIVIPSIPIREAERGKLGVYVAVAGIGRGSGTSGAIYRETAEDNFVLDQRVESFSLVGDCEDVLGSHADETVEDTVNTFDVLFYDFATVESVTQDDIDANPLTNLFRVGDEWVQVRTWTQGVLPRESPYRQKWQASNLWRGRYATEAEMAGHAAGEKCTAVTGSLTFVEMNESDIGASVTLKAVTAGQGIDVAQENTFTFTPYSAYTVTNSATVRTLDADDTTLDEIADFVATMRSDLKL